MHTLGDEEDFLWATTEIAILSCSETGLSITAACCAVLRPLFRELVASARSQASGNTSRLTSMFSSRGNNTSALRRSHKKSTGEGFHSEEDITLHSLTTHGQKPGKDGKGFGTTASVWHAEETISGRDATVVTSPLGTEIVVTKTRNVVLS